MKRISTIIIFIISNLAYGQNKVELRDLTFSVPAEFYHFTEQNRQFDYENFHELGKIFTDSTDLEKFPKIQYQYYEIPKFRIGSSKKVLTNLNEIMTKDIPADTLIINESKNYSLTKYSIMGISVFEIKSLGHKGWINIQYSDLPQNDKKSFENLKKIISSLNHNQPYESEYENYTKESSEHSKRAFIFLVIALAGYLISKSVRKKAA
jgi:hypothetical protein